MKRFLQKGREKEREREDCNFIIDYEIRDIQVRKEKEKNPRKEKYCLPKDRGERIGERKRGVKGERKRERGKEKWKIKVMTKKNKKR